MVPNTNYDCSLLWLINYRSNRQIPFENKMKPMLCSVHTLQWRVFDKWPTAPARKRAQSSPHFKYSKFHISISMTYTSTQRMIVYSASYFCFSPFEFERQHLCMTYQTTNFMKHFRIFFLEITVEINLKFKS